MSPCNSFVDYHIVQAIDPGVALVSDEYFHVFPVRFGLVAGHAGK